MVMRGERNARPCFSPRGNSAVTGLTVFDWIRTRFGFPSGAAGNAPPPPVREIPPGSISGQQLAESAASGPENAGSTPEEHLIRSESFRAKGLLREAREEIEMALAGHPEDIRLHCELGSLFLQAGDAEQALDLYNLALYHRFECYPACIGKVQSLEAMGRCAEAIQVLDAFIERSPGHAAANVAAAERHYRAGDHEAAVRILEPLARLSPVDRNVANLLGLVLGREFGAFERADDLLWRALETDPDWLPAMVNLGWNLLEQGKYREGYHLIDRALVLAPQDADARLVRACMKLKQGEFSEGWADYGSRHLSRFAKQSPLAFPIWNGESLQGRTLLVRGEQGIGDQIMFASCIPDVIALAGRVIVECHPKLLSLFRRSFPGAIIRGIADTGPRSERKENPGHADFQIAMGDLPGFFRNHWDEFPSHCGYLVADPERVLFWKSRLAERGNGFRLGLSWRGGVSATRRHLRSLELERLLPVLQLPLRAVSLQYDQVGEDLERLRLQHGISLAHWQDAIDDYDETAALVSALDGVLSVCTAVVHLAGALSRPVWVLAPMVTEWRYLDKGESMPWYPSVRLVRQRRLGEWDGTISAAREMIADSMANHAG